MSWYFNSFPFIWAVDSLKGTEFLFTSSCTSNVTFLFIFSSIIEEASHINCTRLFSLLSLVKTFLFSVLKQRANEYLGEKKKREGRMGKKNWGNIQICVYLSGIISVLVLTNLMHSISSNWHRHQHLVN